MRADDSVLLKDGPVLAWPGRGPARFICTDDDQRDAAPGVPLQTNRETAAYILTSYRAMIDGHAEYRIADVMCGSGGFLQGASAYLERASLSGELTGYEIDAAVCKLAAEKLAGRATVLCGSVTEAQAPPFDLVFFSPPQPNLLGMPDRVEMARLRKGMPRWRRMMSAMLAACYVVTQRMLSIELTDCYDRCQRYVDVSGEAIVLAQSAGFALRGKTLNARRNSGLEYNDTSMILFFTPE